ncbi:MAG: type I methionyl aminopeptidase [Candidatus Blackburnbacteria bacterium]|nr:type I methionyl aminopeptidase [Candidatus Blackburnbacteria bacterium]
MVIPKTLEEIEIVREGGQRLARIKDELRQMVCPSVTPIEIERRAECLILEAGGQPSFKMVRGYRWATCININEGVVHGIPGKVPFKEGDIVTVDVGIFYKGFHSDSAFTLVVGQPSKERQSFLGAGKEALRRSIKEAKQGNRIADISRTIQEVLEKRGYSPVYELTGHGIGRQLHEDPQIPCFLEGDPCRSPLIPEGAVLAIEVIYTQGSPRLVLSDDGWTISTKDGKIGAVFEETVAVVHGQPQILTA